MLCSDVVIPVLLSSGSLPKVSKSKKTITQNEMVWVFIWKRLVALGSNVFHSALSKRMLRSRGTLSACSALTPDFLPAGLSW